MMGLYVGGIIVGILVALLFNHTLFKGNPVPFVMELPNYRFRPQKACCFLMWDKAKDFIQGHLQSSFCNDHHLVFADVRYQAQCGGGQQ